MYIYLPVNKNWTELYAAMPSPIYFFFSFQAFAYI